MQTSQALVLGGSIAGLLAARALGTPFDQVTIVERDSYPAMGEQRKGVSQGRQIHALLAGGRRALDASLPGLTQSLLALGALEVDAGNAGKFYVADRHLPRQVTGLDSLLISRQRRRYEQLTSFPRGLLVCGDALCSFNSAFGQGMSVAAQQAVALEACLAARPQRLFERFSRAATKLVDAPWSLVVGADSALRVCKASRQSALACWARTCSGSCASRVKTAKYPGSSCTSRISSRRRAHCSRPGCSGVC